MVEKVYPERLKEKAYRGSCPWCNHDKIVKHGIKNTVKKGKRQRYQCNLCARTFYQD